jgi:hypothetical protein
VTPQAPRQQAPAAPYLTVPSNASPSSGLPQPTAPFSTTRPANLGERVIHPITPSQPSQGQSLSNLMDQELNRAAPTPQQPAVTPITPQPIAQPAPTVQPQQLAVPVQQPANPSPTMPPQAQSSGINFEETPRPAAPFTPGAQPPANQ